MAAVRSVNISAAAGESIFVTNLVLRVSGQHHSVGNLRSARLCNAAGDRKLPQSAIIKFAMGTAFVGSHEACEILVKRAGKDDTQLPR